MFCKKTVILMKALANKQDKIFFYSDKNKAISFMREFNNIIIK